MTLAIDTTDKDNYFAARQAMIEAKNFIDLPRCVSCDNLSNGKRCEAYRTDVAEQHIYTPNECKEYAPVIPF